MTKQTNAFQKAIYYIHQKLEDSNVKISESAELCELNIKKTIKREIDVLIEKQLNDNIYRIAIECRDRSSKDDITWIDGLIGKYKNLPVNKIIAISHSGFSESAELKAEEEKIELRKTEEIYSLNWEKEFLKLGVCEYSINFTVNRVLIQTKTKLLINVKPNRIIKYENENVSIKEFIEYIQSLGWNDKINKQFKEKMFDLYKVKADLCKNVLIEHRIPLSNFTILFKNEIHDISGVIIYLLGMPQIIDNNVRHFRYEKSLISQATTNLLDNENQFKLLFTQTKVDNQINLSYDKKKIK